MTYLTEDQLSLALHRAVPEPMEATPARAAAARNRARYLRTRRWTYGTASLLALSTAVAVGAGLGPVGTEEAAPARPTTTVTTPTPTMTPTLEPETVLTTLRRPLSLPTLTPGQQCPVSPTRQFPGGGGFSGPFTAAGPGPVYLAGGSPVAFEYPPPPRSSYAGSGWGGQKVIWVIDPGYRGPLLLRGAQLDGQRGLQFDRYIGAFGYAGGAGSGPYRELAYVDGPDPDTVSLVTYPSAVRLRGAGCYGVQIDGQDFTKTLVFRAVISRR